MLTDFWQTNKIDRAIAEEFFGWQWMAFWGIPTRDAERYPEERMVRQFMSPGQLKALAWQKYFTEHQGRDADGTEPLSYRYCSSLGPAHVPHFSGHDSAIAELERELRRRKLWTEYRNQLWVQISQQTESMDINEEQLASADCKTRCIAALGLIGSKYVIRQ